MEQNKKSKSHLGGKVTPSARLYIGLGFASAVVAAVILISCFAAYFIDDEAGIRTFGTLFYVLVILTALSLTLSINQLLRGKHALAAASLALASVCLAVTVTMIVLQCVFFGKFFLVPFTPLP